MSVIPLESAAKTRSPILTSEINLTFPDSNSTVSEPAKHDEDDADESGGVHETNGYPCVTPVPEYNVSQK